MGAEGPTFSWFVASLPDQKINLAAFGSIAFPISMVVEGPIIMLLAASTALCKDIRAYRKLQQFTLLLAGILTAIHILIAFTPLYDWIIDSILAVPENLREPGRIGLKILTPWTAAIAYRRFLQGILIRFEKAHFIVFGTVVRLITLIISLKLLATFTNFSGIVIGTIAIAVGVLSEAIFTHIASRSTIKNRIPQKTKEALNLNIKSFLVFYTPLALTPLMTLVIQPAGSAAMSRMPDIINSLAAWQVVHAIIFLTRSIGFAFNEVVVAQSDKEGAINVLNKFCFLLALFASSCLAILALTPISDYLLIQIYNLEKDLAKVCKLALIFGVTMPAYQAYQSLFQGQLVAAKKTKGVTEAVAIYVTLSLLGLFLGVNVSTITGIYWAIITFSIAGIAQTLWLAFRAKEAKWL